MSGVVCNACGHTHAGRNLAYICVGCPCMVRPSEVEATRASRPLRPKTVRVDGRLTARLDELRKRGWT